MAAEESVEPKLELAPVTEKTPAQRIVEDDRNAGQRVVSTLDTVYDGAHITGQAVTLATGAVVLGGTVAAMGTGHGVRDACKELKDAFKERRAEGRRFGTRGRG